MGWKPGNHGPETGNWETGNSGIQEFRNSGIGKPEIGKPEIGKPEIGD